MGRSDKWNSTKQCIGFLIYINDLIDCCEPYSDVYLITDDAKIFRHILCPDDQLCLSGVNEVVQWTQRWLLNLNVKNVKWSHLEEMLIRTAYIQCYTMKIVHL